MDLPTASSNPRVRWRVRIPTSNFCSVTLGAANLKPDRRRLHAQRVGGGRCGLDWTQHCTSSHPACSLQPATVMAEAHCRLRNKLMATLRQPRTRLSRSWIELSILPSCVIPAFCEGGIYRIFIRGDEIPVKLLRLEYHGGRDGRRSLSSRQDKVRVLSALGFGGHPCGCTPMAL